MHNFSENSEIQLKQFQLPDLNGKIITVDQSKFSSLTIVHFWATWCAPCLEELSSISQLIQSDSIEGTFYLIAVNDSSTSVKSFLAKINFPQSRYGMVLLDSSSDFMLSLGTVRLPETHFFKQQQYLTKLEGAQKWSSPFMRTYLGDLLH